MSKDTKLGNNLFYTLKDEDGKLRPLAGLWLSNGYMLEEAEASAIKLKCTVVLVKLEEQS